jgi:peptidoglycan/LPS O-acetylase OafA/YrhL
MRLPREVARVTTFVVSLCGTLAAAVLVVIHYGFTKTCPSFLCTPACTWVLASYSATLTSSVSKRRRPGLFWGGALTGLALGVRFSATRGRECPKIRSLPLCYVSLAAFATMIALRLLSHNRETRGDRDPQALPR